MCDQEKPLTATEAAAMRAAYKGPRPSPPSEVSILAPFVNRIYAILQKHGLIPKDPPNV